LVVRPTRFQRLSVHDVSRRLSIRWILEAVRGRKGRPVDKSLAEELLAAFRREGAAMNKRENVHRMADANKAFSHFAW
jgi:small subunit ribosomal protein S7